METSKHQSSLSGKELNVSYQTSRLVLGGVSLELTPGKFTCLLGPNGAGKSTLLRVLAGLHVPTTGSVLLDGNEIEQIRPANRAKKIGFLPQEIHPHFQYQVYEAVGLGARVAGYGNSFDAKPDAKTITAIETALGKVDALNFYDRHLNELSGGERRRVLIASVLAQEPKWLLMDEPAAMLDLHHQASLFKTFKNLAHQEGIGVLCVTHDFNLASRFADEIVLMNHGKITATGKPSEVITEKNLTPIFGDHFEIIFHSSSSSVVIAK